MFKNRVEKREDQQDKVYDLLSNLKRWNKCTIGLMALKCLVPQLGKPNQLLIEKPQSFSLPGHFHSIVSFPIIVISGFYFFTSRKICNILGAPSSRDCKVFHVRENQNKILKSKVSFVFTWWGTLVCIELLLQGSLEISDSLCLSHLG